MYPTSTDGIGNLLTDRFPISLASHLLTNRIRVEAIFALDLEQIKEKLLEEFLRWGGTIEEIDGVQGSSESGERVQDRLAWRAKGISVPIPNPEWTSQSI